MSEATDTLARLYEAWNRVDVEAAVELLHPEITIVLSGEFPGMPERFHGRDGAREFHSLITGVWESLEIAANRIDGAGEVAFALFHLVGHAREGMTVEREAGHLVRVENGLIVELTAFGSWEATLAAAGVEE